MNTLHKTLSFAQMMVRTQWRHEARAAGGAVTTNEQRQAASVDQRPHPRVERRLIVSARVPA